MFSEDSIFFVVSVCLNILFPERPILYSHDFVSILSFISINSSIDVLSELQIIELQLTFCLNMLYVIIVAKI